MAVRAVSFDVDGSLYNDKYIAAVKAGHRDVIGPNQAFLDTIKTQNGAYTRVTAFAGTKRQSYNDDAFNARVAQKGSCFPALIEVADYIGAKLDKFLMADIYGGLPAGTAYSLAMDTPDIENHPQWISDETKASILYAQMQKMAVDNPGEMIDFDFYDDEPFVLDQLNKFFSANNALIPPNLKLRLHHYDGGEVKPINEISGAPTSTVDYNYRYTVKEMAITAMSRMWRKLRKALSDGINVAENFIMTALTQRDKPQLDVGSEDSLLPELLHRNQAVEDEVSALLSDAAAADDMTPTHRDGLFSSRSARGRVDVDDTVARAAYSS